MAIEPKAAPEPTEDHQLSHLRAREKHLTDKTARLSEHPETKEHDIEGAKQRNELLLKQVRQQIKTLEKK